MLVGIMTDLTKAGGGNHVGSDGDVSTRDSQSGLVKVINY